MKTDKETDGYTIRQTYEQLDILSYSITVPCPFQPKLRDKWTQARRDRESKTRTERAALSDRAARRLTDEIAQINNLYVSSYFSVPSEANKRHWKLEEGDDASFCPWLKIKTEAPDVSKG